MSGFLSRSANRILILNDALGSRVFNVRSLSEDKLKQAKPFESIPRVPMLPLIGSAWAYLPYIGKYSVEKMHRADVHKHLTYGDMVREKFGRFEVVNCYHPDAMFTMMNEDDDDEYPSRGDISTLKAYRSKRRDWYKPGGLLVTEGKEWKDLRNTVQVCISRPEFLEYYINPMNEIARDFVELVRHSRDNKEEIDNAVSYLNKWSLEAISLVALDKRLGCLVPHQSSDSNAMEIIKAIEIQLDCMNKLEASAGNIQFWKYLPTPTWRKFVKAADTFTSLTFKSLTRSAFEAKESKGEGHPSLLQNLTRMGVSPAMILMTDLMMAGIDTTSYTAGFLLYDLAKNPNKQEEVVKEINKLLPAKEDKLTFQKYLELNYLKKCLKESMRLHPVTRGNVRTFKKDVVICGYRIPAGTAILCVLQVVYRNPKYFDMPNEFKPERWEDDEKKYPFFQPFGYGARNCIGSTLAELEILTMATEILRNFTLEYHYEDIGMTTKLINTPDRPMRIRLQERYTQ